MESEAIVTDIYKALHSDTLERRGGSQHTSDLQVNMAASGTVESEANVTDIHEALHFDVLEEDSDDYFQRGFGIWSLSWAASGAEVVAGTGDDSLYLYNMDRQKVRIFILYMNMAYIHHAISINIHSSNGSLDSQKVSRLHCRGIYCSHGFLGCQKVSTLQS